MQDLLNIILPVFLVIGFGYAAVARGYFSDEWVDGLMKFTQNFAIPCLLFRAISTLDLGGDLQLPLLVSYYAGALTSFTCALLGARLLFHRPWEDSVAFGFSGLFSNSVLLGLPLAERAFGAENLHYNYAIVALHAPICYGVGVTAMEVVRHSGGNPLQIAQRVLVAMFRNALVLAIALGFVWNIGDLPTPTIAADALDMMARASLPAALFGLGGVLHRYRPEGDLTAIGWVMGCSLVLHPAVTFGLGLALDLSVDALRAAVVTAALAPGTNTYIFANMYGVAKRVVASTVLLGTATCIFTTWLWLLALP